MKRAHDWAAILLLPVLALLAVPTMSLSTWVTLTVAGGAMGMMLFLMASGLTLIFGLMDSVLAALAGWAAADSWALNLLALAAAAAAAAVCAGAAGLLFERLLIRRVYGSHLQQILITVGGLIVAEQLVVVAWGAQQLEIPRPMALRGSFLVGGAAIEKYRVVAMVLGLVVWIGMSLVLNRTRVGLLVRAGVENREMVEALGFRIRRLFVGVFMVGAALAGIGGAMWAVYQQVVTSSIGGDMTILVFIVVIIGGLGSVTGCFVGAILVGLVTNYVGFLAPTLSLGSTIAAMVIILLWRPRGLFPPARS
jgi:branched-chain amino acid transport system permease protein